MAIKDWPQHEKPREKFMNLGAQSLSDAELLAILFKTGTQGKSAVDISRELLLKYKTLRSILDVPLAELAQHKGLGWIKSISIQAALELARRYLLEDLTEKNLMNNSEKINVFLRSRLQHLPHETFVCIFLDNSYHMISYHEMFHGTIDCIHIHLREILKKALSENAAGIIFAHNHPHGSAQPSQADQEVTQELKLVLDKVDIQVVDHIVVGEQSTFSFAMEGLL